MVEYEKINEELLNKVSGGNLQASDGGQACPLCKSTNLDFYVNTYGRTVYVCKRCYVQWIP